MGKLFRKLFKRNQWDHKIIIVGLDAAGKTTVLNKMVRPGDIKTTTTPTLGQNMEEVRHKGVKLQVWDVGGQEKLRPLWRHFFTGTDGVVFVVDSADEARIGEAANELHRLMSDDELRNAVFLVFANKQDLRNAMTPAKVTENLRLHELKQKDFWMQGCSAKTGDGLYDGFDWLLRSIENKRKSMRGGASSSGASSSRRR